MINNGTFVIGFFNCVSQIPWNKDPNRVFTSIVVNKPYVDQYNNNQVQVTVIDVSPDDSVKIIAQEKLLKGKQVMIPVTCQLREGKSPWISLYMPKNSNIEELFDNNLSKISQVSHV